MQLQRMAAASTSARIPERNFPELQRGKRKKIPSSVLLLQMCRQNKEVKQLHGQLILNGLIHRSPNAAKLVESYVGVSEIDDALLVFKSSIQSPDTFAYNVMIRGLILSKQPVESLLLYVRLSSDGLLPDSHTYTFVLKACCHLKAVVEACGELGALDQGRWIHKYIINKRDIVMSVNLGTALVDMYAKCGCFEFSYQLFKQIPQRDVVTWGAIISSFATHGQAKKCFQLFDEMIESTAKPNGVIFVALLSACSHAGLVEKGCYYFDQMVHQFGIRPSIEHFGCMVDLLGRAGRLAEAEQLILSMPEEPNSVILGALFNACRIHNDIERGRPLFKRLINLEPSPDRYKLAASLFANNGEDYEIRKFLKEKNLETRCGLSNIQVDGVDHEFMVSDITNDRVQDVYETLG